MNKTIKGALGASAAAVLLLGGAGSLAFWTDDATVNGGAVTSGYLDLTAGVCDDVWTYASGANAGATVLNFVPGDSITKDCTFTIAAQGDNLEASPTVPDTIAISAYPTGDPDGVAPATFDADVDATYALDSTGPLVAADTVTEANDGDVLTASIVVTFPFGDADTVNSNDTERITAELDDLTVVLTQDLGTSNPNA